MMMRMRSIVTVFSVAIIALLCTGYAGADQAEREALVKGAMQIAPSVVRIDRVAAQGGSGDLFDGAPTSGLIIDSRGYVITSRLSVSGNPAGLLVSTREGKRYGAKVVAQDHGRELAILKLDGIEQDQLPVATLASVGPLQQGLGVVAVGCALESDSPLLSLGIVSGSGRMWGRSIQSDARVSLAQYGGPLLDVQGRILGILVPATATEMAGENGTDWYDSGVAMAIPSDVILPRLEKLIAGTDLKAGLLGISFSKLFINDTEIPSVHPGSPAARAGLRRGDVIVAVAGQPIERHDQMRQALGGYDAGDRIQLTVRRKDQTQSYDLELASELPPYEPAELGVWAQLIDGGLTVQSVVPNSAAEVAGLKANDRLMKLNGEPIESGEDLSVRLNLWGREKPSELELGDGRKLSVTPKIISGKLVEKLPAADKPGDGPWSWSDFALPEVPNKAKLYRPETPIEGADIGLLVIAAGLDRKELEKVADTWLDIAKSEQLLLLVIGPRDPERWQMDEAEIIARAARQAVSQYRVNPRRVSITGEAIGASLALATALSNADTFRGVVVGGELRLPRVRLKPNDPAEPLQLLWIGVEETPRWLEGLKRLGYAVRTGQESELVSLEGGTQIARWNRLLGAF